MCYTIFHNNLTEKLMTYELGKWAVMWAENYLSCQSHRVAINDKKFSWKPVPSGVPPWSVLG